MFVYYHQNIDWVTKNFGLTFVFLFNSKFFYAEAKFSFTELGCIRQRQEKIWTHMWEDSMIELLTVTTQ